MNRIAAARWANLALMVFMLAIALSPLIPEPIDPQGTVAAFVRDYMFIPVYIFLTIQFDETTMRSTSNIWAFMADNALGLANVAIGAGTFLTMAVNKDYTLSRDLILIILQGTLAAAFDLAFGVIISQRIAASTREREENRPQR